jgi:hypothetical protein
MTLPVDQAAITLDGQGSVLDAITGTDGDAQRDENEQRFQDSHDSIPFEVLNSVNAIKAGCPGL